MLLHLLLARLFIYALARTLGMGVSGAFLAAVAYEFSGLLYLQTLCCFTYVAVMSWLPIAFLGAELAVQSLRWVAGGWKELSWLVLGDSAAFLMGPLLALITVAVLVAARALIPFRGESQ